MRGDIINRRIKPGKNTMLYTLPVMEQVKLIFKSLTSTEAEELEAARTVSLVDTRLKGNLVQDINKAVKKLDDHDSVVMKISSKYKPYIKDIINPKTGLGRYYNFETQFPDVPNTIEHYWYLRIRKKGGLSYEDKDEDAESSR